MGQFALHSGTTADRSKNLLKNGLSSRHLLGISAVSGFESVWNGALAHMDWGICDSGKSIPGMVADFRHTAA